MKQQRFNLNEISWQGIGLQILKYWWIVVAWAVAAFLGATGIGSLTYTPQYTASATLVIRMAGSDAYTSLVQTTQMTAVYSEIFQSSALRSLVSESTGEEAAGTISCSQISETNLLVLSATSPTPRQAYLFIHAALQNYEQVAGYVFTNAALEIVQEPSVPETPSNASFLISRRVELACLAAVAAAGLIALIYLLRYTVKTADSAASLLDGTVLGTVQFEKRQGMRGRRRRAKGRKGVPALLLNSPLVSMDFAETSRRMATRLEAHLRHKKLQILLVTSVEENEGKSTVAANVAVALAEHGSRVALLDGDLRKPAQYKIFDKASKDGFSLSDVLAGRKTWKEAAVYNEKTHIWELFQYKSAAQPGSLLNGAQLPALLEALRDKMDVIVVDCSPIAVAADAEIWMHHVDSAALVVRQDMADVRVINDAVDLIWKSTGDFSGFILNAFQQKSLRSSGQDRYGA